MKLWVCVHAKIIYPIFLKQRVYVCACKHATVCLCACVCVCVCVHIFVCVYPIVITVHPSGAELMIGRPCLLNNCTRGIPGPTVAHVHNTFSCGCFIYQRRNKQKFCMTVTVTWYLKNIPSILLQSSVTK